jgi:hypothetical protein
VNSSTVASGINTLPVPGGLNTANVTGNMTPTYPLNSTMLGYSALLTAASFNVALDVLPSAKPFGPFATCPGSTLTIEFNPGAGTWQAAENVAPAMNARAPASLFSTSYMATAGAGGDPASEFHGHFELCSAGCDSGGRSLRDRRFPQFESG